MAEMSNSSAQSGVRRDSHRPTENAPVESLAHPLPGVGYSPEQLIALARDIFVAKNHKPNAALARDLEREQRIDRFVETSLVVHAAINQAHNPEIAASFPAAAKRLLRCFERLCVRTNLRINDAEFRTQSYQYLLSQLARNTQFFGFNPKVLARILHEASYYERR